MRGLFRKGEQQRWTLRWYARAVSQRRAAKVDIALECAGCFAKASGKGGHCAGMRGLFREGE
jgi:hypothetical protein